MSAYDMDSLLNKWERGTITTEQAVGQILLLIQQVSQRVGILEKRMEERRRASRQEVMKEVSVKRAKAEESDEERPSSPPPVTAEDAPSE